MKFNISRLSSLTKLISELSIGLNKLSLKDNFESFETEVTIASSTETKIQHSLGFIPSRYLIVSHLGNGVISKGTTEWNRTFAYLYNYGPNSVTLKVIFQK